MYEYTASRGFGIWERFTMWVERWKAVRVLEGAAWKGCARFSEHIQGRGRAQEQSWQSWNTRFSLFHHAKRNLMAASDTFKADHSSQVILKTWLSSSQLITTQFIPEQSCLAADRVSNSQNTPAIACQRDEFTLALGISLGLGCCSLCSRRGVLSSTASPQPQT